MVANARSKRRTARSSRWNAPQRGGSTRRTCLVRLTTGRPAAGRAEAAHATALGRVGGWDFVQGAAVPGGLVRLHRNRTVHQELALLLRHLRAAGGERASAA